MNYVEGHDQYYYKVRPNVLIIPLTSYGKQTQRQTICKNDRQTHHYKRMIEIGVQSKIGVAAQNNSLLLYMQQLSIAFWQK